MIFLEKYKHPYYNTVLPFFVQVKKEKNETVTIEVYVGRISVKKAEVQKTETNWTYSYTTSGVEEVQINIDGTQEYKERVDFSAGDTTINVSK